MKTARSARLTAAGVALALLATACGDAEPAAAPADGDGGTADASDLEELEGDAGDPERTAEEVYAEIAAMDLSDDERVAYLEEKAREEGAILSYGSANLGLQEPWSEGFQEAYPEINHLYVRQRAVDLYERVSAEANAGRHLVDVINANAILGARLAQDGLLAEHHGVPVPAGYPSRYVEDWAVAAYISPNTIAWNTNAISEEDAPRDWDDFLEPEHAGCVIDVGPENFVGGMILDRGIEATREWWEGFLANDGQVRSGHSSNAALLAAGEFDCMVYNYLYLVEGLIEEGAPLEWHAPTPTPANATSIYIYKHTERPHAAALFMHWLLSVEGAQVVADDGRISIHPDVDIMYPRLAPFLEEGSDEFEAVMPMLSEMTLEVDDDVHDILNEYTVPNVVGD